jgi:hypothetical protein
MKILDFEAAISELMAYKRSQYCLLGEKFDSKLHNEGQRFDKFVL